MPHPPAPPLRLALNTGGGDAPGLNAVIRAVVLSALHRGWEVYGIRKGYEGLFDPPGENGLVLMGRSTVQGLTAQGGTILGTTNRGNPLRWPRTLPDGSVETVDRSGEIVEAFRDHGLDALIAIGGDGSLRIAAELHARGLPVVGVPKTIDNDLAATEVTFGFHTAVQTASDAIDKLHSTAASHSRIMVVEVMGRDAGWIALYAGLAGAADVILLPEIPWDMEAVAEHLRQRMERTPTYGIVVVAEGAFPKDGTVSVIEEAKPGAAPRYGGAGERVAAEITARTGFETRSLVLGHLQRGGQPVAFDRILSLRFGAAAVELVAQGHFGCMVALDATGIRPVSIADAVRETRNVPLDAEEILTARTLGICLGDRVGSIFPGS
jgi:ATP-dependent phosphofructokinase / diphosphate-dependent phosphofructokinase